MIEIISVIFSLLAVWLTTKRNIWFWPIGIIGIIFYFNLFLQKNEYCNMLLQVAFLTQSIIGWINWGKEDKYTKVTLYNTELSSVKYLNLLFLISIISFIYYIFSFMLNGKLLILDSITAGISLIAMWLLTMKKIEAWILWIITDILYIPFFIQSELYLSAITYSIFLGLAVKGLIDWKKEFRNV
jgi:nicotinamide mononucleotide transporter